MPVRLHGINGLDPGTSLHVHLIRISVLPVLTYGLEVILPGSKGLQSLELCEIKLLKRTLSLPNNMYTRFRYLCINRLLTGGQSCRHENINFFNNICRQDESSLEKRIAYRQLTMKDNSSCSWLVFLYRILHKYNLPNVQTLLDKPVSKLK